MSQKKHKLLRKYTKKLIEIGKIKPIRRSKHEYQNLNKIDKKHATNIMTGIIEETVIGHR